MMRPGREQSKHEMATYFISSQTAQRQPLFRHERWAHLLLDTIKHYGDSGYTLHAYVFMPDHVHILITPHETLEKAVQLIKGGFSFRARKAFGWKFEIWQPGFADHRIRDESDWSNHLEYIRMNPVQAGLVSDAGAYPFIGFPRPEFPPGLKPTHSDLAH